MIRKAYVEGGLVCGIPAADPRITAFKGIPFAAPPVGENRWRAPQPVVPWEGERLCAEFGPIAMQEVPGAIIGWNIDANSDDEYYTIKVLDNLTFTTKEYLWPIRTYTLRVNTNLVQNPYWE